MSLRNLGLPALLAHFREKMRDINRHPASAGNRRRKLPFGQEFLFVQPHVLMNSHQNSETKVEIRYTLIYIFITQRFFFSQ